MDISASFRNIGLSKSSFLFLFQSHKGSKLFVHNLTFSSLTITFIFDVILAVYRQLLLLQCHKYSKGFYIRNKTHTYTPLYASCVFVPKAFHISLRDFHSEVLVQQIYILQTFSEKKEAISSILSRATRPILYFFRVHLNTIFMLNANMAMKFEFHSPPSFKVLFFLKLYSTLASPLEKVKTVPYLIAPRSGTDLSVCKPTWKQNDYPALSTRITML